MVPQMLWTRKCIETNPKWNSLLDLVNNIEASNESNPNTSYDYCKSLIESICKTILEDLGIEYSPKDDLPKIAKLTIDSCLNLTQMTHLNEAEKLSVKKIRSGLANLVQEIAFLRNKLGRIGHGQDIQSKKTNKTYAQFISGITDSLGGLLITNHDQTIMPEKRQRLHYEEHNEFNDWFDNISEPMNVGTVSISPSEALHKFDPNAYKDALLDFESQKVKIRKNKL